jgi:hypothetical protein
MIEEALCETFGGTPAEHPTAVTNTATFLRALAAAGDQGPEAVELLERVLAADAKVDGFRAAIGKLTAKYPTDQHFLSRCADAVSARSELAALEKANLLSDWHPGLSQVLAEN